MNKFSQMLASSRRQQGQQDPRMQAQRGPPAGMGGMAQQAANMGQGGGREAMQSPLGSAMRPQTPMPGDPSPAGGMGGGIMQRARQELMKRELQRRGKMQGAPRAMGRPMDGQPVNNPPMPEMY